MFRGWMGFVWLVVAAMVASIVARMVGLGFLVAHEATEGVAEAGYDPLLIGMIVVLLLVGGGLVAMRVVAKRSQVEPPPKKPPTPPDDLVAFD